MLTPEEVEIGGALDASLYTYILVTGSVHCTVMSET